MANTTISISRKFQSWLKSKGKKGENYENIIKGLLKPDVLKDLELYNEPAAETLSSAPKQVKQVNESDAKNEPDVIDTMFGGKLSEE